MGPSYTFLWLLGKIVSCSLVFHSHHVSIYLPCSRELLEDICNECAPIAVKACDLQDSDNEITTKNDRTIAQGDSLALNHPLVGSKELKRQVSKPLFCFCGMLRLCALGL